MLAAPLFSDWRTMESAPKDSRWVMVLLPNGEEVKAHYACDLSGSEQPPFRVYFREHSKNVFVGVDDPTHWRPI